MRFLARYDGDVSEPLVGRQGSRVSMRMARGSASLLSSHGRGIWPRDVLKKVSRGLSRVEAGNPGVPRLVQVTSGASHGGSENSGKLEVGGASRDSTGFGALEEGLISSCPRNLRVPLISDSDRRVPADWGQESQASSWVEAWNSACLSRCLRGERPLVELYLEPGGFFRTMHGRVTAPSC